MKPKYVPSLELCRQLEEAGWKKDTEFWWVNRNDKWIIVTNFDSGFMADKEKFPSPLSDEILEELSEDVSIEKYEAVGGIGYEVTVPLKNDKETRTGWCDLSLPNALAKMWLYLKEKD